jgi:aminoglycoside 6-adenylyltransferase
MIEGDDLKKSSVEEMLDRLVRWAETQPDISAIINQGSRARIDHPADQWSDLDLIVYTSRPERYLTSTEWLENIGNVMLTFLEKTATGDNVERRALFEGGVDVDFSIIPKESLVKDLEDPSSQDQDLIRRGVRVLHDKTGLLAKLPEPSKRPAPTRSPPTKGEFDQLVNDFLYHIVWTAKKLRRGELWTAKACCDSYMKWKLLGMIEWHTLASKGWDTDVWFSRSSRHFPDPLETVG